MHSLIIFLLTISFTHLQSEAQNDGFTLDLIHRYSAKSPFYNSSMTLQERFQRLAHDSTSRHRRHVKNFRTNYIDTSIIPGDGDYLVKIAIGTPPMELFAIADTGSDLIWVQCKTCDVCYSQTTTKFDPKKSSSYSTLPCNSTFCANIPSMQCDYSSDECEYYYGYGTGSTTSAGIMGTDMFSFASFNTSSVFGCGIVQDGGFDSKAGGLVGLGGGPLSLVSQLSSTIPNKFSYCLTPSTSNSTSRLRLGSSQATTGSKPAVVTPLVSQKNPTYYSIDLKGISVGQQEVEVNKGIVVDSGSTLTYLETSVYLRLEAMVKEDITGTPMQKPPEELRLCYEKQSGSFQANLNMVFQFDGGELELGDTNLFIDFGDYVCLAIVPSDVDGDPMILGNVVQVNFEVEIDLNEKTVSMTPSICSQDDAPKLS